MKDVIEYITGLFAQSPGVDITIYDGDFLSNRIARRFSATNSSSPWEYLCYIRRNVSEASLLLESLNITYTEFFRNPITFAYLERIILPSIVSKKLNSRWKEVRIWSVACASGQESYSLAMLLEEIINSQTEKINYRIFATDHCESQVIEARKGEYTSAALNNLNMKRMNQWFTKEGDTYFINSELKEKIDYSVFDLFSEQLSFPSTSIFGEFDLVMCANLLFYYKSEYRKIILKKTRDSLANDGYLVCGEAERDILNKLIYREVFPQSAIFQI